MTELPDAGDDLPNSLNVVIEISSGGPPVKYEVDKRSGLLQVDRFINVSMYYPANYGFIPQTLAGDGDPLDVLVMTPVPLYPGCIIKCRPIGGIDMEDEAGEDVKLVALPLRGLYSGLDDVDEASELDASVRAKSEHFFSHYKDLEQGKWVRIRGWFDKKRSEDIIMASIIHYAKDRR